MATRRPGRWRERKRGCAISPAGSTLRTGLPGSSGGRSKRSSVAGTAFRFIHGRLSDHRAQAITDYIDDRLLPRLRPHALELTDAFELRDEHIRADIATGQERARQEEAREYYASLRARGLAPIDEKDLLAAQKKRAV